MDETFYIVPENLYLALNSSHWSLNLIFLSQKHLTIEASLVLTLNKS